MSDQEYSSDSDQTTYNDNNKRGIRGSNHNLEYWDGTCWIPAVYHHTIRAFLIEQASRNGKYSYGRERGLHPEDITSYLESQKDWGPVRDENWAEILYVFDKTEHQKDPEYVLEDWMVGGKIVISGHDNLPMLAFKDVPDTLSSALEGRDMEAMKRTDSRIQHRDFLGRMPMEHTTKAGTKTTVQSPSSISMKMTRFRAEQGMLSWVSRLGSQTIRNALWERLPQENKQQNSIRGLQPPTLEEQRETRKGNAGRFSTRAGKNALTRKERNRRHELLKKQIRSRQGRERFETSGGGLEFTTCQTMPCAPDDNGLVGLLEGGEREGCFVRQASPDDQQMQPLDPIHISSNLIGRTPQPRDVNNPSSNSPGRGDDGTAAHISMQTAGFHNVIPFQRHRHDARNRMPHVQQPPATMSTPNAVEIFEPLSYLFQPAAANPPVILEDSTIVDTSVELKRNLVDKIPYRSEYQGPPTPPFDNDFGSSLAAAIEKSHQLPNHLHSPPYPTRYW